MENSNRPLYSKKKIVYWLMTQCVTVYDEFQILKHNNQRINIIESLRRKIDDLDIVIICDYILLLIEFVNRINNGQNFYGIQNTDQFYLMYDMIRFVNDIILKKNDEEFTANMLRYFNDVICSKYLRYPFCNLMTVCFTFYEMLYENK